jgi:hypothetical protein
MNRTVVSNTIDMTVSSHIILIVMMISFSFVDANYHSNYHFAYKSNSTCDTGYVPVKCDDYNCVAVCQPGYRLELWNRNCDEPIAPCRQCLPDEWCDGTTEVYMCAEGLTSDYGSASVEDCRCRVGELRGGICDTTCDTGFTMSHCERGYGEAHCFPACDPGYKLFSLDCKAHRCDICTPGGFCDGRDYFYCPPGMRSPPGSSEYANCTLIN